MENKKLDKKVLDVTYNATIKRIDNSTGKVIESETIHNLVVDTGKTRIRDLIGGASTTAFTYVAIGEGAVAPASGDTALGNESERESATVSYPASDQVKYEKVFTFGSGVSYTVTEAGLLDSAVAGVMLNRLTFAGKAVDADTDLSVTITITVG